MLVKGAPDGKHITKQNKSPYAYLMGQTIYSRMFVGSVYSREINGKLTNELYCHILNPCCWEYTWVALSGGPIWHNIVYISLHWVKKNLDLNPQKTPRFSSVFCYVLQDPVMTALHWIWPQIETYSRFITETDVLWNHIVSINHL